MLAVLTKRPGRAVSFADLRRAGWGDSLALPIDAYSVRSLILRLRLKLRAADAPLRIEAVRGFGFRADIPFAPPTDRVVGTAG